MKKSLHIGADRDSLATGATSPDPSGRDNCTSNAHLRHRRRHMVDASESVYFARRWIEENPKAWAHIVDLAKADAKAKRRISISRLTELARATYYPRDESEPFKIDNRLRPGLARILAKEHPEVAPFIEFRRASCDGMA